MSKRAARTRKGPLAMAAWQLRLRLRVSRLGAEDNSKSYRDCYTYNEIAKRLVHQVSAAAAAAAGGRRKAAAFRAARAREVRRLEKGRRRTARSKEECEWNT